MGFVESIETCFTKYFVFSGRAIRSEYWYFALFALIGVILISELDFALNPELFENETAWYDQPIGQLELIFQLAIFFPSLFVAIRRLHDVNRSGWWLLIQITIIGIIPVLYWMIKPSDAKSNKYGAKSAK